MKTSKKLAMVAIAAAVAVSVTGCGVIQRTPGEAQDANALYQVQVADHAVKSTADSLASAKRKVVSLENELVNDKADLVKAKEHFKETVCDPISVQK